MAKAKMPAAGSICDTCARLDSKNSCYYYLRSFGERKDSVQVLDCQKFTRESADAGQPAPPESSTVEPSIETPPEEPTSEAPPEEPTSPPEIPTEAEAPAEAPTDTTEGVRQA